MHYIIIIMIVLLIIITLAKHILFNPKVNAVLGMIVPAICLLMLPVILVESALTAGILGLIIGVLVESIIILVPAVLTIIDCLRDFLFAEECYKSIDVGIDKFFVVKGLLSLFTFGFARIVFIVIVNPIISYMVSSEIENRIAKGEPLPASKHFSSLEIKNYYYKKHIEKLETEGMLVSNINTVDSEAEIQRKKLDKLYPEKIVAKIVDMIAGDAELKRRRKSAEEKLSSLSITKNYAYLKKDTFNQFSQLISEAMANKGHCSVSDIKKFEELNPLRLTMPLAIAANDQNTEWGEYFIIQALQPLVADGIFDDNDFNDNNVFDNHVYHFTKSSKSMPSIDGDSDPRFALDDD